MKTAALPTDRDPEAAFAPPWYASADSPEADLLTVADHDFSGLCSPILVACRDQEQLDEFIFREGLMCSEVRRFRHGRYNPSAYPKNKILILLPDWQDHFPTSELVHRWVNIEDRYTVQLNSPKPIRRKPIPLGILLLLGAVLWGILWILYINLRH